MQFNLIQLSNVFFQAAKSAAKKRERVASEPGESTPKPIKKMMKSAAETPGKSDSTPQDDFKPFNYSQSDLKVFAGKNVKAVKCWFVWF